MSFVGGTTWILSFPNGCFEWRYSTATLPGGTLWGAVRCHIPALRAASQRALQRMCNEQSLAGWPPSHLEMAFLGQVPRLSHEVAGRQAPCTRVCDVNGCAYHHHHHRWDVRLDVPPQLQSNCLQWNSNACWWEQWENVNVYTRHPAIYNSDKQNNCYIF